MNIIRPLQTLKHGIMSSLFPLPYYIGALESITPEAFAAQATPISNANAHIISLFKYHDPLVQRAIWEVKYRGNQKIASLFAVLLLERIKQVVQESEYIIIPLPSSKERRKERGWNQTELISKQLTKAISTHTKLSKNLSVRTDFLYKKRHTLPQSTLSRKQRLENLKNCFDIHTDKTEQIKGKKIILIDDVTTTGSTILEAKAALEKAGSGPVMAFTVAH
jgi:competence protein ComFC